MQRVEIDFCHPKKRNEIFTLSWSLIGHEPSFIWFKLLCKNLQSDKVFFNRFTGFTNGMDGHDEIMARLNHAIDTINADGRYYIPERAEVFNQEFSNAIHHHFEILAGSYEKPTEFVAKNTEKVNDAMRALNFLVHDLEAYTRNLESPEYAFAGVINEVYKCDRFHVPAEFDKYFSMDFGGGDLVAHYSQVGKTWIEAFYDKDEDVFPTAIRPLYAFSGEFDLMFGKLELDEKFYNDFHAFLRSHGKDPQDPSLRLGHLTLAKLHNPDKITIPDFKQKLAYFNDIASIRAYDADTIVASKHFETPFVPLFK